MQYDNYIYVYFRVDSPYKWGKGMDESISKDFNKEAVDILEKIGLTVTNDGSTQFSAPQGQQEAERLYMHPMDFSGILTKERFDKAKEVIENYESKIFSLRKIDVSLISSSGYKMEEFKRNIERWKEFKKWEEFNS